MTRRVYLDHAATTPLRNEVLQAMLPYFSEASGNASSLHTFGRDAREAVEQARRVVATAIGADSEEIVFTSGGTVSDNMAIKGAAYANRHHGRHLITSAIEHHAVLNTCRHLESEGFEVTYLPVSRQGIVDLNALADSIRDDTVLISVMLANNELGTVQPLPEIAALASRRGIPLHTDAVQGLGKMPVDVDDLGVDLLSLTAHKFNGPKGTGALYVRKGTRIAPLLHGGHQEGEMCPGTENVPGIVGLAKALDLACQGMAAESARLTALRNRLESGIREHIPAVHLSGHPKLRLPNILNMSFAHAEGEALLMGLDMQGIAVSTGSACSAGSGEPSHVLQAIHTDLALAQGSLRFSLGHSNDEDDVDYAIDALVETVTRLRELSPSYEPA